LILLLFAILFSFSCQNQEKENPQPMVENLEQEKTAILECLKNETKAACRRDYLDWKTYWIHDQKISKTYMNFVENSFSEMKSWKEIDDFVRTYLEEHPEPVPPPAQPDVIDVRIYGSGAWVTFEVVDRVNGRKGETRLMQKEAGKWKIAGMHTSIYGFQK